MPAIERLLADDAVLEMTGTTTWFSGKATCVPFIAAQAIGQAGDWRMIPLLANGQLAAAAYHLGDDGYRPFAIVVLATTLTHLTRIVSVRRARAVRPLRPTRDHRGRTVTRDQPLTRHPDGPIDTEAEAQTHPDATATRGRATPIQGS